MSTSEHPIKGHPPQGGAGSQEEQELELELEQPGAGSAEVAEFDERRAKMERLRAEGINPYPPVTLWGKRTKIADVLSSR